MYSLFAANSKNKATNKLIHWLLNLVWLCCFVRMIYVKIMIGVPLIKAILPKNILIIQIFTSMIVNTTRGLHMITIVSLLWPFSLHSYWLYLRQKWWYSEKSHQDTFPESHSIFGMRSLLLHLLCTNNTFTNLFFTYIHTKCTYVCTKCTFVQNVHTYVCINMSVLVYLKDHWNFCFSLLCPLYIWKNREILFSYNVPSSASL